MLLIPGTFPQTYLRRDSQFIAGVLVHIAAGAGSWDFRNSVGASSFVVRIAYDRYDCCCLPCVLHSLAGSVALQTIHLHAGPSLPVQVPSHSRDGFPSSCPLGSPLV